MISCCVHRMNLLSQSLSIYIAPDGKVMTSNHGYMARFQIGRV